MCVIIASPKGTKRPTKRTLELAALYNPHGFGFVSDTMDYKSMDFDLFMRALKRVPKDENLIIHFRYATTGSKISSNCHPFHGYDKNDKDVWFAHNGVLPFRPKEDITDSQFAFENYILPTINTFGINSKQATREIDEVRGSSRFAILYNHKIHLYGNYFTDKDGIKYSNLNFMRYTKCF